jgi:hypothetical protein
VKSVKKIKVSEDTVILHDNERYSFFPESKTKNFIGMPSQP